ncbi:hypothetical protein MVEN_02504100 [Mycena venus]|uniref:Uncharacterized protein n=1 Tax=Mycena venus TaxID=2733690 RepID=A0A8H6WRZ1_9AGAR|nr:hypothetical protein MVEN_02504100 [Mycena venus]
MEYTVDSEAFDSLWYFVINTLSQTAVSLVLYGVYVNLFLFSLYTLSRRKTTGTKLLMIASCVMAVVGSTQMALDVAVTVAGGRLFQRIVREQVLITLPLGDLVLPTLQTAQNIAFAINNGTSLITDSIFVYRCYVIWGFQKKIIILPSLLMLSTLVVGIWGSTGAATVADTRILFSLGAATNLVLTTSTAGRILWIRRAAAHVTLDSTVRSRYSRAIVILLESGAVYCIAAIFGVISVSLNNEIWSIGYGIGQQLLNIIPTLTLVYIGLKDLEVRPKPSIA